MIINEIFILIKDKDGVNNLKKIEVQFNINVGDTIHEISIEGHGWVWYKRTVKAINDNYIILIKDKYHEEVKLPFVFGEKDVVKVTKEAYFTADTSLGRKLRIIPFEDFEYGTSIKDILKKVKEHNYNSINPTNFDEAWSMLCKGEIQAEQVSLLH